MGGDLRHLIAGDGIDCAWGPETPREPEEVGREPAAVSRHVPRGWQAVASSGLLFNNIAVFIYLSIYLFIYFLRYPPYRADCERTTIKVRSCGLAGYIQTAARMVCHHEIRQATCIASGLAQRRRISENKGIS